MNNNINTEKLFDALKGSNKNLESGIKNRNVNQLISALSDSDKAMLNNLLKDQKARDELLSSPQVKQFLNTFMKKDGKKDG